MMERRPITAQVLIDYLREFPPDTLVCVRDEAAGDGLIDVVGVKQSIRGVVLVVDSNGL